MKTPFVLIALAMLVPAALRSSPASGDDSAVMPRKVVLVFTKSSGYEHSVIADPSKPFTPRPGGSVVPGLAFQVLRELGAKNNIEFVFSKDGSLFKPAYLAQFDAFFFYTTGDLTERGTDGNPPMSKEGKAAFLEAIYKGKGFIGTHSATDTFHSPGGEKMGAARWKNDGDNADPYVRMIGAEFIVHGGQQKGHQICVDRKFPGMSAVPADFAPLEEWYTLKDFAPNLHVLLVQDTSHMEKTGGNHCYDRPDYPSTWAHLYGKGRVFYTSMGHREDVWTNPVFQQVLLGGVNWAVGNVKAKVKPNMDQGTPWADVLPSRP